MESTALIPRVRYLPILATLVTLVVASSSSAAPTSCKCTERWISFAKCNKDVAFRRHTHGDIGLVGGCIPPVPANDMRCWKWRTAESCPGTNGELQCKLNRRREDETDIIPDNVQDFAVMKSPGYNKKNYRNRSFCVYNISLSCSSGQTVALRVTDLRQSPLEDGVDYLWFSEPLVRSRLEYVTGNTINNFSDEINAHSFLVVLWSNGGISRGRFQIAAECSGDPTPNQTELSSGDEAIIQNQHKL